VIVTNETPVKQNSPNKIQEKLTQLFESQQRERGEFKTTLKEFLDTYKKGEVQKSDFDAFIKEVKEYVKKDDKSSNYFSQFYKDYIGPYIGAKS
jgi:hypothetical protein